MILAIYLVLLVSAIVASAVTLRAGSSGELAGVAVSPRVGMIASTLTLVLWGLIAVNSFELTIYSGGTSFTESYPQLAWLAVAGVGVGLVSLLQATLTEIDNTGGI